MNKQKKDNIVTPTPLPQQNIDSNAGDKLNKLQIMFKDRTFLMCLLVILIIIFIYVLYKNSNLFQEHYIPITSQNIQKEFDRYDEQKGNLNSQQEKNIQEGVTDIYDQIIQ